MSKILYVTASNKPEGTSRTIKLADHFVENYRKNHPEDEIITLDLYKEPIDFLREDGLNLGDAVEANDHNHPILKYAYQFHEADKYIIAAPMWNLSFPAIVKAYIDYIAIAGINFKYTSNGPVGTNKEKKAIHIVTRGGNFSEEPMASLEMGNRYLQTIFNFFGITDFTTLAADNVDRTGQTEIRMEEAFANAELSAKSF